MAMQSSKSEPKADIKDDNHIQSGSWAIKGNVSASKANASPPAGDLLKAAKTAADSNQ